jgi:hypothetical protein
VRSFNEAFADYIEGQVAGGVTHTFLRRAFKKPGTYHYCSNYFHPSDPQNSSQPCLDDNLRGTADSATSHASVGRFVTLLQDLFDGQLVNGQPAALGQNLPGDGDLWEQVNADGTPRDANFADDRLVPFRINATSPVFGYGNGWDNGNDNVALPGPDLNDGFVSWLAARIFSESTFTNEMVYSAAAVSMATRNVNWCDACRVLAIHSPDLAQTAALFDPSVPELFAECVKPNGVIQRALLPLSLPEPNGNIDAATCTPCAPGQVTDPAGTCVPCRGTVQGNRCIQCPADVTIDGGSVELSTAFEFDPSVALAGDTCPELFWVQVNRPDLVFARGRTAIAGRAQPKSPATQATCIQPFQFQFAQATGGTFGAAQLFNATGQWACQLGCSCEGLPGRSVIASEATTESIRFGMPAGDPNKRLSLAFGIGDPR